MFRQPGSDYGVSGPVGYFNYLQQQQQQQQQPTAQYVYNQLPTPRPSSWGPMYTRLGHNIVASVNRMTPRPEDIQVRQILLRLVTDACSDAMPHWTHRMQVKPFGSFVSGLGTHDSDLDLVVTGVMAPRVGERFYDKSDRPVVSSLLDKINKSLRRCNALQITKLITIRHARMPVSRISALLMPYALPYLQQARSQCTQEVSMDISIATDAGPMAAQHLAEQGRKYPALRPLGLIVKAYLKALNLNDVATGGLSSYGLMHMVLAHIMRLSWQSVVFHCSQLRSLCCGFALQAEQQEGNTSQDLAWMLHRFFVRYGEAFDTYTQCVSTRHGGIVHRSKVPGMKYENMDRICCIDPLTGYDCTEGAIASKRILSAFEGAAAFLSHLAAKHTQGCPPDLNILDELLGLRGHFTEDGWRFGSDCSDDTSAEPPAKLPRTSKGDVATGSGGNRQANYAAQADVSHAQGQLFGYQYPDAQTQAGLAAAALPKMEVTGKAKQAHSPWQEQHSSGDARKQTAATAGASVQGAHKATGTDLAAGTAGDRCPGNGLMVKSSPHAGVASMGNDKGKRANIVVKVAGDVLSPRGAGGASANKGPSLGSPFGKRAAHADAWRDSAEGRQRHRPMPTSPSGKHAGSGTAGRSHTSPVGQHAGSGSAGPPQQQQGSKVSSTAASRHGNGPASNRGSNKDSTLGKRHR